MVVVVDEVVVGACVLGRVVEMAISAIWFSMPNCCCRLTIVSRVAMTFCVPVEKVKGEGL